MKTLEAVSALRTLPLVSWQLHREEGTLRMVPHDLYQQTLLAGLSAEDILWSLANEVITNALACAEFGGGFQLFYESATTRYQVSFTVPPQATVLPVLSGWFTVQPVQQDIPQLINTLDETAILTDCLLLVNADGYIQYCNRVWITTTGSQPSQWKKFQIGHWLKSPLGHYLRSVAYGTMQSVRTPNAIRTLDRGEVNVELVLARASDGQVLIRAIEPAHDLINKELIEKKLFYERILENLPADLAVLDANQRYLYLNPSAVPNKELREWLIGRDDYDYCRARNKPLSLADNRRRRFMRLAAEGRSYSFEETQRDSNNQLTTSLRIIHPVMQDGRMQYAIGYGLNISQLKQSETTLLEYKQVIEMANDGIALLDARGVYLYVNPAHLRVFGYDEPSELEGKHWSMLYGEQEVARIASLIDNDLAQNGSFTGETMGRSKHGSQIFQEITLSRLPEGRMVCICRDITEKRLKTLEMQKLALVASHTSNAVTITDARGNIEWVNAAYTNQTGYGLPQVRGRKLHQVRGYDAESQPMLVSMADAMLLGQPFMGELSACNADGQRIWLLSAVTPIHNADGQLAHFVAVENDITLIKKAEKDINQALEKERQLSSLKSQFVALASHEFRTPLAVMQANLDLITMALQTQGVQQSCDSYVNRISGEIERITQIMNKILLAGMLETSRIELSRRSIYLHELAQQVLDQQRELSNQQIDLHCQGEPQLIGVDSDLIQQVMINLISNGLKYGGQAAQPVQVAVSYESEYVKFAVTDHGIGIPEEDQQSLLLPFYRASNAQHIKGIGLGLVLVQQLVQLHGGTLTFSSRSGGPTTFEVTLPVGQ